MSGVVRCETYTWDKNISEPCIICPELLKERDLITRLSCGHYFHNHCITTWLWKSPRGDCPICRGSVTGVQVEVIPKNRHPLSFRMNDAIISAAASALTGIAFWSGCVITNALNAKAQFALEYERVIGSENAEILNPLKTGHLIEFGAAVSVIALVSHVAGSLLLEMARRYHVEQKRPLYAGLFGLAVSALVATCVSHDPKAIAAAAVAGTALSAWGAGYWDFIKREPASFFV